MPLSDVQILDRCQRLGMITPFEEGQVRESSRGKPAISWGVSSYGYDIRVGNRFKIFTNLFNSVVDPKGIPEQAFQDWETGPHTPITIPPNSFALAESFEYLKIPRDVVAVCVGKSTYARCGIIVNVTPLEPEWEGRITIEISNTTPCPARVYANEGIMQVLFYDSDRVCETSYKDRKGRYDKQTGITLPTA